MPVKDLKDLPKRTAKGKVAKMITLSPYARVLVARAAEATAMTHSGLIETLIRRHCKEMISAEKALLASG
jgi:hypothetical protein